MILSTKNEKKKMHLRFKYIKGRDALSMQENIIFDQVKIHSNLCNSNSKIGKWIFTHNNKWLFISTLYKRSYLCRFVTFPVSVPLFFKVNKYEIILCE